MVILDGSNILMGVEADDRETVIRALTDRLVENGYVEPSYADAVLEREEAYPTGLPTDDVPTALPHAFDDSIKKTGVAAAQLRRPVSFRNMADREEELPVELVFLLANASGEKAHLGDLQALMACFCRAGFLAALKGAETAAEFADIFAHSERYEEM